MLIDNGRSAMFGTEFQEMLRCIRCAACMNHCPVYGAVGGHAYGWVYPGPMGSVLTPSLIGVDKAGHLPNASTFCGKCESVCPVRIPLPKLMRHWREREFERHLNPVAVRTDMAFWGFFARRPRSTGWRHAPPRSVWACSAAERAASAACRWRVAGRPDATCRPRRVTPSSLAMPDRSGGVRADEPANHTHRHPPWPEARTTAG